MRDGSPSLFPCWSCRTLCLLRSLASCRCRVNRSTVSARRVDFPRCRVGHREAMRGLGPPFRLCPSTKESRLCFTSAGKPWHSDACDQLITSNRHPRGLETLVVETEHAAMFLFRRAERDPWANSRRKLHRLQTLMTKRFDWSRGDREKTESRLAQTAAACGLGMWCTWLPFALPQRWPFCWWVLVAVDHFSRRAWVSASSRIDATVAGVHAVGADVTSCGGGTQVHRV